MDEAVHEPSISNLCPIWDLDTNVRISAKGKAIVPYCLTGTTEEPPSDTHQGQNARLTVFGT